MMGDLKVGKIEFGPLQCSQGGIPYNKAYLDAKDARIAELEASVAEHNAYANDLSLDLMKTRQRIAELEVITAEAVDDARLLKIDNERLRAAILDVRERWQASPNSADWGSALPRLFEALHESE